MSFVPQASKVTPSVDHEVANLRTSFDARTVTHAELSHVMMDVVNARIMLKELGVMNVAKVPSV